MNAFDDVSDALVFPLSSAQRHLWTLAEVDPTDVSYNVPFALRCRGPLDSAALRQALIDLHARHEILRTRYTVMDAEPVQQVLPAPHDVPLPIMPLDEAQLDTALANDAAVPFDLGQPSAMRARLYVLGDQHHVLSVVMHHIACDGWSVGILLQELAACYNARVDGESPVLSELPLQYADYAEWEQEEAQRTTPTVYWQRDAGESAAPAPLPGCGAEQGNAAGSVRYRFPAEVEQRLEAHARDHKTTLFVTLLAGFMALLHRLTQAEDVCVGVPVANRTRSEVAPLVGYFVNTLVMREQIAAGDSFDTLVERCRTISLEALEHQHVRFEQLIKQTSREHFDSVPFFALFAFQNAPSAPLALKGIDCAPLPVYPTEAKFDLTLHLEQDQDGLVATFEFRRERILPEQAQTWMTYYARLLEAEITAPQATVGQWPLLDEAERTAALALPVETSQITTDLCTQFEAMVAQHGDAVAVSGDGLSLTYAQLDGLANRLAWRLREQGIGTGPQEDRVGLSVERGPALVIGILGILKAGGAYVPLDPAYPAERLHYLVSDSGIQAVVGDEIGLAALSDAAQFTPILLDGETAAEAPPRHLHPQQAAYVIYTSGSTGQPKGCVVSHANVLRLFTATDHYGFSSKDVWSLFHSYAFDFSVWELWGALLHGGRVVVVPYLISRDPARFAALLEDEQVTVLSQTPAAFRQLLSVSDTRDYPALRLVTFGGEALVPSSLKRWHDRHGDRVRLVNMYGITETTVHVTEYTLDSHDITQSTSVIGAPIADLSLQVLDRYGEPVPTGVAGELHVGGAGVTRGYLGRPGLTAQRFVPDAYGAPGARVYRSGDLGRRLPDGELVYAGRADHQVKLRGFRIELGEIEAALRALNGVREAVVILDTPETGEPRLVGYVVGNAEPASLREALSQRLPVHMVPAILMPLESLPLTAHGKVDTKALPTPDIRVSAGQAPRTEVEKTLAAIWSDVLNIPTPSIDDNFFSLGGDSINSLQIVAKARAAGIEISPRQALLVTTLRGLADVAGTVAHQTVHDTMPSGPIATTPIAEWFRTLTLPAANHWNQALALEVRQPLPIDVLEQALAAVGQHHDAFRQRFAREAADGLTLAEAAPIPLTVHTLASNDDLGTLIRQAQGRLDLVAGPIACACLIQRDEQPPLLMLMVHHLAVDAVSWHILLEDIGSAIAQRLKGETITLPPVATGIGRWGERLRAAARDVNPARWLALAAQGYPTLPRDGRDPTQNTEVHLGLQTRDLDVAQTRRFQQLVARGSEARATALLCAALWRALGEQPLAVTLEHNGRDAAMGLDLSRTVGWFTSLYPFCFARDEAQPASGELLADLEYRLLDVAPHKLAYGLARWLSPDADTRATLEAAGLPEISLNYLGAVNHDTAQGPFALQPALIEGERAAVNTRPFALDLVVVILNGQLRVNWQFAHTLHQEKTVAAWADAVQQHLTTLVDEVTALPALAADFPLAKLGQQAFERLVGPRQVMNVYPLSPLQEGMLFHSVADPEVQAYHEQIVVTLDRVDPDLFRQAWERLLARHDILRSSFHWEGLTRPLQVVQANVETQVVVRDWREGDQAQCLDDYLAQDSAQGVELSSMPSMRVLLARVGEARWQWVLSYHHILLDGWSLPLLMNDLMQLYRGLASGQSEDSAPPTQFGRHIAWLMAREQQSSEPFWRQALAGLEQPTLIAAPQANEAGGAYRELWHAASPAWEARVTQAARQGGVSLGSFFQAAWALFLSLSGHGDDVVFGTTMSGRDSGVDGIEHMVGLFINTLPLRLRLTPHMSVQGLLQAAQQAQVDVLEHGHDRLVDVQRWSELEEGSALFDSVLVIENYPASRPSDDDEGLQLVDLRYLEHSHYPVTLAVLPEDGLRIKLDYDPSRLDDEAAAALMARWVRVIGVLADDLERPIGTLTLMDADDRQRIEAWNADATHGTPAVPASQLFDAWVATQPQAPALLQGDTCLTYAALAHCADALAETLRQRGVGPERVVGVMLPHCPEAIITLLAILKAGGVYLPLSPDYPAERLNYMLRDSRAMLLVSLRRQATVPLDDAPERLWLDDVDLAREVPALPNAAHSSSLAYLIYTSGSTGQPKPVGVTHSGLANLSAEHARVLGTDAHSRVYMFAPLSFDASIGEVAETLFSGGALVLPDGDSGGDVLAALEQAAARHAVTHVLLPPVLLNTLPDTALPSVHTLMVAGDAAAPGVLARWAEGRRIFNAYGPSENTVCTSIEPCTTTASHQPLGRPMRGVAVYLLDPWGNPVPPGVPGELYLGGIGLARGYLGRPALTAAAFCPDHLSGTPGARLYRTGDFGRALPDGRIEYLGRAQGYAKLRGNRIDLDGVAQLLQQHPTVREALAMIAPIDDRQTLVAYVLDDGEADPQALRDYMAARVASFEVPGVIVPLQAWPLTPAGKIDRKALPALINVRPMAPRSTAALTPAEAILQAIWSQALGHDAIDPHDDYFALGGDSILALHIASRAREQGLGIQPRMILQQRTIAALAASAPVLTQAAEEPAEGEVLLSPMQRWFFEQRLPAPEHWNLSVRLVLHDTLAPDLLQQALDSVLKAHPALRLAFEQDADGWRQRYRPLTSLPLTLLPADASASAAAEDTLQRTFDLSAGGLLRMAYRPEGGPEGPELLVIAHHLVMDTWSLRVLLDDVMAAYAALRAGTSKTFSTSESYRRWNERLSEAAVRFDEERAYWEGVLSGVKYPAQLPWPGCVGQRQAQTAELDAPTSAYLSGEAHQVYRSHGHELLLAALTVAWQRWSGESQLLLDLETQGREGLPGGDVDLSRSIGWFTAMYPVRLAAHADWPEVIDAVKRSLRDTPHAGLGYGVLRYMQAVPSLRALPTPAIGFNYLGRTEAPVNTALGVRLSERDTRPTQNAQQLLPHALSITWLLRDGRLHLTLAHADVEASASMQALSEHYCAALSELAEHCRHATHGGYQTSDFSGVRLSEDELSALLGDLEEDFE